MPFLIPGAPGCAPPPPLGPGQRIVEYFQIEGAPSPVPAPPSYDYRRVAGDDWPLLVLLTDHTGAPQNLSGYVLGAELSFRGVDLPVFEPGTNNGGVLSIDAGNGAVTFRIPLAITAQAPADNNPAALCASTVGGRLVIYEYDTQGSRRTIGVKLIRVLDKRFVTSADFPLDGTDDVTGLVTSVGIQGAPGAAISVNGHTGPVQTVTADDVGAYTSAQVDALLAAAKAGAVATALIFGG